MRKREEMIPFYIRAIDWNGCRWRIEVNEHMEDLVNEKIARKAFQFFIQQEKRTYNNPDTKYAGNKSLELCERFFDEFDGKIRVRILERWHI